jgi:hypothetical protein
MRKALPLRSSREIEMLNTRSEPTRRGASGALRQTGGAGNGPYQGLLAEVARILQELEGRNDSAIKRTAAEAVSEDFELHPGALGGATAAALGSAERARSCQLRDATSSGQASKEPLARVASSAHRPTALGERQLGRLLGALHERGVVNLRAAASSA